MAAPDLTDGVVRLSAFELADVDAHVAGEDAESVRWLTDGHPSTIESTTNWAREHFAAWERGGGARRMLAVRERATSRLAGMIEANLDHERFGLTPGEVNISYMIQPWARGRGYAVRAVNLMCMYLEELGAGVAVLRIHPGNAASLRVALKAGFVDTGWVVSLREGRLRCFRLVLVSGRGVSSPPGAP